MEMERDTRKRGKQPLPPPYETPYPPSQSPQSAQQYRLKMGIKDLLTNLKPVEVARCLNEYRGATAAVDASGWMHKAAANASSFLMRNELGRGESALGKDQKEGKEQRQEQRQDQSHQAPGQSPFVQNFMTFVDLVQKAGIKPILVFDGGFLPLKSREASKRSAVRAAAREKAAALLSKGEEHAAASAFGKAIRVTRAMQDECVAAAREAVRALRLSVV